MHLEGVHKSYAFSLLIGKLHNWLIEFIVFMLLGKHKVICEQQRTCCYATRPGDSSGMESEVPICSWGWKQPTVWVEIAGARKCVCRGGKWSS